LEDNARITGIAERISGKTQAKALVAHLVDCDCLFVRYMIPSSTVDIVELSPDAH